MKTKTVKDSVEASSPLWPTFELDKSIKLKGNTSYMVTADPNSKIAAFAEIVRYEAHGAVILRKERTRKLKQL